MKKTNNKYDTIYAIGENPQQVRYNQKYAVDLSNEKQINKYDTINMQ
jgi:hypothetical protein